MMTDTGASAGSVLSSDHDVLDLGAQHLDAITRPTLQFVDGRGPST
jgi:hypothetical protein